MKTYQNKDEWLMLDRGTPFATLPLEIEGRLRHIGDFYLDAQFNKTEERPPIVKIKDQIYYRFMDFLYLPQPPESLSTEQIIEICDLRMEYMDHLVVAAHNEHIVAEAVRCAQAGNDRLVPPIKALDFGCGSGLSSTLLQKYWPGLSLIGVDISEKAVARSREQHLDARLIKPDQRLPFDDATFDLIFAIFVMHFNVGIGALAELRRVLQPGGSFVFNVYQRDIDEVQAQLQDAGFNSSNIEEISGVSKTHRMVRCSVSVPGERLLQM
jgi:SAM-dependent methyltransferase